ncbi:hypothetical protein CPB84DRAFT_1858858 [Gymnopilus junonius]|uniref:Uncharacterized protein n=1 Tax=Gymnopilus junonius TaxID=109634 RepID=A0A9P5TEV8_GYMJU|nr:hypothetical protein CPB84DRAFT_1858858 [Gymnopilus junonius]
MRDLPEAVLARRHKAFTEGSGLGWCRGDPKKREAHQVRQRTCSQSTRALLLVGTTDARPPPSLQERAGGYTPDDPALYPPPPRTQERAGGHPPTTAALTPTTSLHPHHLAASDTPPDDRRPRTDHLLALKSEPEDTPPTTAALVPTTSSHSRASWRTPPRRPPPSYPPPPRTQERAGGHPPDDRRPHTHHLLALKSEPEDTPRRPPPRTHHLLALKSELEDTPPTTAPSYPPPRTQERAGDGLIAFWGPRAVAPPPRLRTRVGGGVGIVRGLATSPAPCTQV